MRSRIALASSFAFVALAALPAAAQNQVWVRQFGASLSDALNSAAQDATGGVYFGGQTSNALGGPNAGSEDALLVRYDNAGNRLWIRQFGTGGGDFLSAATADGFGGVYVGGRTDGNLAGPNAGSADAWLARYNSAGNRVWIRQLGTGAGDSVWAAAPELSGGYNGVYVGGRTAGSLGGPNTGLGDVWFARYDAAGNQAWIRQIPSSGDDSLYACTAYSGLGVFVGGTTTGGIAGPSHGGEDAWVARYDNGGNEIFRMQIGTGSDDGLSAITRDGVWGMYLAGATHGGLGGPNAGGCDAWLAHCDGYGGVNWIRQLGNSDDQGITAIASDGSGGVCVSGYTSGSLGGPSAGNIDVWLARYDSAGNQIWISQFGTAADDYVSAATPEGSGCVYLGGFTEGSLGGPNSGSSDAWLMRNDVSCSVSLNYCTAGTTTNGCLPSIASVGSARASAGSGFTLTVSNVEGQQNGLVFYGLSSQVANPWGTSTSFMCVKSPLERLPIQNAGGTVGQCNGTLSTDWNHHIATHPLALGCPFAGGETVFAQGWFRDPPSSKTTNLSNGLQFVVCP